MFDKFLEDTKYYVGMKENLNEDGSVNWNFIDTDMYWRWYIYLDGETYTEWFNKAADIVEGVDV